MSRLWLMKGDLEAPGWQTLRSDYEEEKVEIVHLDPKVWAMIRADSPPSGYEGLAATEPPDGLYLDPNGSPLYFAGGKAVNTAVEVVRAIGGDAVKLLEDIGDPTTVLERMGRVF